MVLYRTLLLLVLFVISFSWISVILILFLGSRLQVFTFLPDDHMFKFSSDVERFERRNQNICNQFLELHPHTRQN